MVYKNEIIAYGYNSYKTHPLQKKFGETKESTYLHAEIDTIRNAMRRYRDSELLMKCTLYVARIKRPHANTKAFVRGLACPCEGCMRAIVSFGLKRVVYTTDEGYEVL